jgi:hypothetical protein
MPAHGIWIRSFLHGRIYSLDASMEYVCCFFVSTETFVLSCSLGINLHGNVRYFHNNALLSKSLHLFIFVSMDTLAASTQLCFVSKNRISSEACLPVLFLGTAYMSQCIYQDQ